VMMFRQLKVPLLGMVENMSFFDVDAYLKEHGGTRARQLLAAHNLFDSPEEARAYLFGRGGARRRAEQLGVPFLGEVPLNINIRERGDAGRISDALEPGSASRPYLLGMVEQLAAQISIQNIKAPKMPTLQIIQ
jgi:ATP-binding protein involved in chromosome partitioning